MAKSYRPAGVGMIPAEPGTYLVHAYFDDNQVDLVRSNVVGWQVSQERILTPLVVDQRAAEDDPWFVVHPDERVECNDGRCWGNVEDWIDEERRRRRDALAQGRLQAVSGVIASPVEEGAAGDAAQSGKAEPARRADAEIAPAPLRIPKAMPDPEPEAETREQSAGFANRPARWM